MSRRGGRCPCDQAAARRIHHVNRRQCAPCAGGAARVRWVWFAKWQKAWLRWRSQGCFFSSGLFEIAGLQERIGDHCHQCVSVQAVPRAALEMVEAQLSLNCWWPRSSVPRSPTQYSLKLALGDNGLANGLFEDLLRRPLGAEKRGLEHPDLHCHTYPVDRSSRRSILTMVFPLLQ